MSPAIVDRARVTLAAIPPEGPDIGDILLYRHPEHGKLVLHRAIGRKADGWIMRGDNCLTDDGVIPPDHIVAMAVIDGIRTPSHRGRDVGIR